MAPAAFFSTHSYPPHSQELYNHFWAEMEVRVRGEGVVVRLSKWLRELEAAFYGSSVAYDAALAAPPAGLGDQDALAVALRRNVLMDGGQPADGVHLARYVRHVLACLTLTPGEAVLKGANGCVLCAVRIACVWRLTREHHTGHLRFSPVLLDGGKASK